MSSEAPKLEVLTAPRRLDSWILLSTLTLVFFGALMVYSASATNGDLAKQGLFTIFGLGALGVGACVPYQVWRKIATPIAAICLVMLVLVIIPHVGASVNGGQRWFHLGGLQIQPSEIAKIGLTIYFAVWLTNKGSKITDFKLCTAPFGLILAAVCFLIVIQPDLGTALVIACAMIMMFFLAGARLSHLSTGMGLGFFLALGAISVKSYRDARIQVWLHPWDYTNTVGFQTTHALEALGTGGFFGIGLGNSHQRGILPAASTDSIFALVGEQLGFVGATIVVVLFLVLAWRGIQIAQKAPDQFGRLLAVGITVTIVLQAFLNMAVITNTVPFTGVPLPFISYGGSSLVVSLFSIGILLNISREANNPFRVSRNPRSDGPPDESRPNRRQNRRPRFSGIGRRPIPAPVPAGLRIIRVSGQASRLPRYG